MSLRHSFMINSFTAIETHFGEIYSIWHMDEKRFKRFCKAYMGDDIKDDTDLFESRVLIVNMLIGVLKNDMEVVINEIRKKED